MGLPCGTFNSRPEQDMAIVRTKTQWFLVALTLVFFFTLVLFLPDDWKVWLIYLGMYAVAVLGLHILTGLCGQFSMGHAAFMAVGAYTVGILAAIYNMNSWLCLPLSAVAAGLVGLVFGIPALRIKGFYLVMSTIAAQFIIIWIIREWLVWEDISQGGTYGIGVPYLPGIQTGGENDYRNFWWLTMGIVVVMVFLAKNIQRTSVGRKFIAVRDNDLAAEVMGINLFRTKLLAFFIGCSFAGVAGWLWAHFMGHITPDQFTFNMSLIFLGMVIVGGMGSTAGAVMGTGILRLAEKLVDYISASLGDWFPDWSVQIAPAMSLIVFAAVVMFFIMVEPRGAYHRFQRLKIYYRLHPFSY